MAIDFVRRDEVHLTLPVPANSIAELPGENQRLEYIHFTVHRDGIDLRLERSGRYTFTGSDLGKLITALKQFRGE